MDCDFLKITQAKFCESPFLFLHVCHYSGPRGWAGRAKAELEVALEQGSATAATL